MVRPGPRVPRRRPPGYTRPMSTLRPLPRLLLLGLLLAGVAPTPAAAQPADGFRFGVTFGGISTFGLVAEAMDRLQRFLGKGAFR